MKGAQGPFPVGRSRTGLDLFATAVIEQGSLICRILDLI
jgi:hypothetical protein